MPDVDRYFDQIDAVRIRRAKELSEIKRTFGAPQGKGAADVNSKAAVMLAYANWEGFYNECVRIYVDFLRRRGGRVQDTDWMLLVAAFSSDFDSLRDRNHSSEAKHKFVADLKMRLECEFDSLDVSIVEARSNLDYGRLHRSYSLLNFKTSSLQLFRLRLDKELVGWRHSVAHGDSPDLSALDIAGHVDFTANLLIVVADCFQYAMLARM